MFVFYCFFISIYLLIDFRFRNDLLSAEYPLQKPFIDALEEFISVAEKIRLDQSFEGSNLDELDKIFSDKQVRINQMFRDNIGQETLELSQSFFALAAPSLEGKTQSAFVFRRILPLYFPLSHHNQYYSITPQHIYQNFKNHADTLAKYAMDDLMILPSANLNATTLRNLHKNKKLWVLGFLFQMVNETRHRTEGENWMRFHSRRPSFDFIKKNIQDIPPHFFDGYLLFLDEFIAKDWAVYVRNLARAAGLNCLVANTTTRVANIIGTDVAPGGAGHTVWSIVISKLNPPSFELLNGEYNLEESISVLRGSRPVNDPVCLFLDNFISHQIVQLRPGIAVKVALAFRNYAATYRNSNFSLGHMMDYVVNILYNYLTIRKPNICGSNEAFLAKVGLLIPKCYESVTANRGNTTETAVIDDFSLDIDNFVNKRAYLEYHLYYLANPQNPDSWIFLTFGPSNKGPSRVYNDRILVDWNLDYTFFYCREIFTILTCLCIPFIKTVAQVLGNVQILSEGRPTGTHDTLNKLAMKNSRDLFEVKAASIIVDASQHMHTRNILPSGVLELFKYTFRGQNGLEFVKNIIFNLITSESFVFNQNCTFQMPSAEIFNLENFLNSCRIPFLYGINSSIPILDQLSSIASDFYIEPFERTGNFSKIDARFNFKENGMDRIACMECKNFRNNIGSSSILRDCLLKALNRNNARLSLIICTQFARYSPSRSSFKSFCITEKINIYRVSKVRSGHFQIIPFDSIFQIHSDPELICVLFESTYINKT